ncbi:cyclophilin-like fold protein [Arthrobacter sp. 9V]|uniref:cyclophilin-like fold protein n=1 Tax=Arthrobacter sp. 9V TaxID=2653132 RepID=UPI001EED8960|nr:cyclophilin-like fold protein [Arthrobacter sp. 9V]
MPRPLRHEGSPGSDPEDGDLIYFVPWGNLGFYYDASGIGFSDQTIHLGRYDASREELSRFDGQEVRVEVSR